MSDGNSYPANSNKIVEQAEKKLHMSLEKVTRSWLSSLNIPVSRTYLHEQLLSHPEYPSLLSITDTLSDLGIENSAYMVEKDKLREIPIPFLAWLPLLDGEFIVVENVDALLKKYPDFYTLWEGVAVVAEKSGQLLNKANDQARIKEIQNRKLTIAVIIGIILFSLLSLLNNFSATIFLFLLVSLAGIAISILIVQRELGYSNSFTDKLCGAGPKTNCKAILHSKGSKLLNWLDWADVGIIYFSAQWLLLIIALFTNSNPLFATILPIIAAAAVPFTFFSVYYQWNVKKWCPLCLIIVSIVWIQFLLLLPALLKIESMVIGISQLLFAAFVFFLASAGWLAFMKPLLKMLQEAREKALSFSRFKKSPEMFMAVLEKQRTVDITPFKDDLQLGNPGAPLQLMFACNPYCEPCAKAHEVLHNLIEKYNDKIGLTVRFMVGENSMNDDKAKAVKYLLKQVLLQPENIPEHQKAAFTRQLMHDWFEHMDMGKFTKQYPLVAGINAANLLQHHAAWTIQNNIESTPTIFINGFQLLKPFSAVDLPEILFGLLNRQEEQEDIP